jgi:two-component system NarL family response regulator
VTAKIRILLVDDHEMVREGVKSILEPEPDFVVVGDTGLGAEVPDLVERTRPQVVLLDARLPDSSGPEVCRALKRSHPHVPVIILTSYSDDELVEECINAGARGFVVKDVERFSLKQSIRAVSRGEAVLAPQVAGRILDRMRDRVEPARGNRPLLNATQLRILQPISQGFSNREIAAEVHLSENTVKSHVQEVFHKLEVRNRVEAAIKATKEGLI